MIELQSLSHLKKNSVHMYICNMHSINFQETVQILYQLFYFAYLFIVYM